MKGVETMTKGLDQFKLPRWNDLPPVDLYLEQMLTLIDDYLGDYLSVDGKKVMTKTMVNNYVKQQYLNAPVNKRYDRLTVACLFVIATLKSIYTIEEIKRFIDQALSFDTAPLVYDQFCEMTEQAVSHAFNRTAMPKPNMEGDPRDLFWNLCNSFACQLYVKKVYLHAEPTE